MAIVAFIIPFMFSKQPDLLMLNGFVQAIPVFITAAAGCICLAGSLEGFLLDSVKPVWRIVLGIGGIALMYPTTHTDIIGVLLVGVAVGYQVWSLKKFNKCEQKG